MSLKDQLSEDLKDAMRQQDDVRKTTVRLAMTAIKNAEVTVRTEMDESGATVTIAARTELDDDGVMAVLAKEAKQRRDSIEAFKKADRQDLVDKESAELRVLEAYLPETMSRDDVMAAAKETISEVEATGPSDKGKVMKALMPKLAGRAEGREINEIVTELLAS
ncbi:MAG: GatB/YqeY domain-containing protein [Chloroflexi bacterium]|nr:GatB/YqeY domain-containing protein [Chloroflexota bacterium]